MAIALTSPKILESKFELKSLERSMRSAESYVHWRQLAEKHDALSGARQWKERRDSKLFDARQIHNRYHRLRARCEEGASEEILFALNEGIHGNMGGMGNAALYERSRLGTKRLIEDYVATICEALKKVAVAPGSDIPFADKLDFFRRASHCFGRSALALSGGSGLIYFHHGVVHSLLEAGLLPKVMSGSSAGAWMCAQIGTRTDEELRDYFLHKRYNFDHGLSRMEMLALFSGRNRSVIEKERDEVIDAFVGNMTFQEAFEHTGRYINISIAPFERHQTSRLMNAIASPSVTIRSAVRASSSVPGMVDPVMLEAKDSRGNIIPYLRHRLWVDGSFAEDLPFKRMSRLFGVNHFIVSMINPMAVPFLRHDPKTEPDSISKSLRSLYFQGLKETIKTARRWTSPGERNPADTVLGTIYKLMNQDYSGDINIFMKTSQIRPRHVVFRHRDEEDIHELVLAGQRACWPKLDRIRIGTAISAVVDELLETLEQEAMHNAHGSSREHMTL